MNALWQELIDAGISEHDIEKLIVAGISLEEQVSNLRAEYEAEERL